ncbi:MAG: Cysteine--tRNA ligase [Pseudomonadota bacterium]
MTELKLFNSLTRSLETFKPIKEGEARVYSCGPTVYNYQHIGNMRAYVFADTLGRVLSYKGYKLTHVVNITDVGHLTDDADAGEDKMEKMAASQGKSAWDIAAFYQADFEADLARLNIRKPAHPKATEYVEAMIDWAKAIEAKHCYELDSGLYFDTSTVSDYGRLARAATDAGESRIDPVDGKRHAADFAIWRKTPPGETRQMEWDSPWGRGAPGWHLECSVMSQKLLGHPFDIHTGGIDHREIHHPNEIAQNQAHGGCDHSGAGIWMHNNFLIDRRGKMSKSAGEFLRLQTLVDKGFHPLAYRLMCLQAHYRSELEFSWEGLLAAFVRLKRMVMLLSSQPTNPSSADLIKMLEDHDRRFDEVISDDLGTPTAVILLEQAIAVRGPIETTRPFIQRKSDVLGLDILELKRTDLRIRPKTATITEEEIETALAARKEARAAKDFAKSDAIRDDLIAKGVEVMDGDPLGWDWKIEI